jgi:hypothetical protein
VPIALHTQTIIACIWDFDKTLIPGYSQQVIFDEFGIDAKQFWAEVNGLVDAYGKRGVRVARDTAYLGHMLTYVSSGLMPGLSNAKLLELGGRIPLNPGLPEFFEKSRQIIAGDARFSKHDIKVEHYVVSTGMRALIEGSAIGAVVDDIWANDFIESPMPPDYLTDPPQDDGGTAVISQIGYMIDNTSKTRAVFEINKGINALSHVDVNTVIPLAERRVPIPNMVYIADGPSDIPVFSVMNQYGGHNLAVFSNEGPSNFAEVKSLQDQGRVQMIGAADYTDDSVTYLWLMTTLRQIAERICDARDRYVREFPGAPDHIT